MTEPALQPVHIVIKQFGVTDGTERHVELTVAAERTLGELFAALAPEHRAARGLTWRFQVGERVLDWSARVRTLAAEYAGTRHVPGGVLWLDLWFFADRPVGNDFTLRTPGSTPGFGARSSESNLPTLPDLTLAPPGAAPTPPAAPAPEMAARKPEVDFSLSSPPAPVSTPADEDEDLDEEASGVFTAPRHAPPPTAAKRKARVGRAEVTDAVSARTGAARQAERRATVRYYTRMNPDRMFPLLVILSERQVREVVKARVGQAESTAFKVEEGSVVEVEPVLPGCDCYPARLPLAVEAAGPSTATIWVVPKVLGRVQGARVLIRQDSRVLAEVPLEVKVSKQTLAVACGLLSLAAPYLTTGLKSLKLDYESQKAGGFPLYYQVGGWLADLRPEWIGLGFLGLAVGLYFLMRPKRRDVFWDVNLKG